MEPGADCVSCPVPSFRRLRGNGGNVHPKRKKSGGAALFSYL